MYLGCNALCFLGGGDFCFGKNWFIITFSGIVWDCTIFIMICLRFSGNSIFCKDQNYSGWFRLQDLAV